MTLASHFRRVCGSSYILIACRFILAVVFIYAATGKLLSPAQFADTVAGFRILPLRAVNLFAIVLPWVELLCGFSLLLGIKMRSCGLLLAMLNILFIAAAASAMIRGLNIECGCFTLSHSRSVVGITLIARDLVFFAFCLPVVLAPSTRDRPKPTLIASEI